MTGVEAQVRRQTKLAQVVIPALVGLAVLTPTTLWILWLALGRPSVVAAAIGFSLLLAFARILFSGPPALVRRALAGQPALDDLLPADLWAQLFVLPIATVTVSALSSVAFTIGSLTVGEAPVLGSGWRVYAVLFLLLSGLIAVLVPVGAAYRAVRQRAEDEVRLFDDSIADDVFGRGLEARWRDLRERPRWWITGRREGALGRECGQPARAWPTLWRQGGGSVLFAPATLLCGLAATSLIGAGAAVTEAAPSWVQLLGSVMFLLALPAFAVVVDVYRLLLMEQSRSQVLRAARARREGLIASRPNEATPTTDSEQEATLLSLLPRLDLLRALLTPRRVR